MSPHSLIKPLQIALLCIAALLLFGVCNGLYNLAEAAQNTASLGGTGYVQPQAERSLLYAGLATACVVICLGLTLAESRLARKD